MASTSLGKGTRKTYSFEEREILVNLICKYLNDGEEDKNSETGSNSSTSKRKSVWVQLTEEYNTLVGSDNSRTSIQLRRCWENMKANKKNRDDKRISDKTTTEKLPLPLPTSMPSTTMGLPPNVVFQPNDSEPFTFEGLMPPTFQKQDASKEKDLNGVIIEPEQVDVHESAPVDALLLDAGDPPTKKLKRKSQSPKKQSKLKVPKSTKVQKNELYEFTITEAQLKLDTAAILKEEAKLKLEEAEYRKEESRMRMICATYKLQKLREDCEAAMDDEEEK